MDQPPLFYEDINEAIRAVVTAMGGAKTVSEIFWPEKNVVDGAKYLNNCLDSTRNEKLSLEQIMYLLKKGREIDCHTAMHFINVESGYAPPQTREPEDEVAELQREYIQSVKAQGQITKRLERILGVRSVA